MEMFILMVVVFILGYTAIALEHPLKIDKAASALILGMLLWVIFVVARVDILSLVNNGGEYIVKRGENTSMKQAFIIPPHKICLGL